MVVGANSLKWAFELNKISLITAESNGLTNAVYFNLDFQVFKDDQLIQEILAYINHMKPEIIFYRIKNKTFSNGKCILERANYKAFIDGSNQYKIMNKAMAMMLNADSIGFVSLELGLDAHGEPIRGIVNQDIRVRRKTIEEEDFTPQRFGRYFNPQDLLWWKFDAFDELYTNK